MKRKQEKPLDMEMLVNNRKNENTLIILSRYTAIAYMTVQVIRTSLGSVFEGPTGEEQQLLYFVGLMLPTLFYCWFILYNLRQANHERNQPKIESSFRSPFIILDLIIISFLLLSNLFFLIDHLAHRDLGDWLIMNLAFIASLLVIAKREFQYLKAQWQVNPLIE